MFCKILPRMLLSLIIIFAGLIALSCGGDETAQTSATPLNTQSSTEVKTMQWDSPPKIQIDTQKKYTAIMETEKGKLVLELFAKDVPKTVNNFVFLSRQGFYDGTTFHRVLPDFMAQGGDPTGTGSGGPGYKFEDEFTIHKHDAGVISMANSGSDTNGSQFFITYVPTHHLDGKHTVFGRLIEGMDVLKKITPRDPSQNPKYPGDKLVKVTIVEE